MGALLPWQAQRDSHRSSSKGRRFVVPDLGGAFFIFMALVLGNEKRRNGKGAYLMETEPMMGNKRLQVD